MHLGERECSIQRRHQKLVEEAPSPAVTPDLREWMGAAAVSAAEAVGYLGAGTCEFLLARRPLVLLPRDEHPDPGRAPGDRAGLRGGSGARAAPHRRRRADAGPPGLAQSARLGDRVPDHQRGSGERISPRPPGASSICACPAGPGVRWDGGVEVGDEVTLYYDSMLAKLIVWAPDRRAGHRPHAPRAGRAGAGGRRHQPGLPSATARRSRLPGGRHRHPVPRAPPRPRGSDARRRGRRRPRRRRRAGGGRRAPLAPAGAWPTAIGAGATGPDGHGWRVCR